MREYIELDRDIVERLGLMPCSAWKIDQYDKARNIVVYAKKNCEHPTGGCYPRGCPPYYSSDVGLAISLFENTREQLDKNGSWRILIPQPPEEEIVVSFAEPCGVLFETYGTGDTMALALARASLSIIKEIRGVTQAAPR